MRTIEVGDITFQVEEADGGLTCGRIVSSNLKQVCSSCGEMDCSSSDNKDYNAAIDGIESFMLALLCVNPNISPADLEKALDTAVNARSNNLSKGCKVVFGRYIFT